MPLVRKLALWCADVLIALALLALLVAVFLGPTFGRYALCRALGGGERCAAAVAAGGN